jgi:hypothetical protein
MVVNFDDSEASRREHSPAQNIVAFDLPCCDRPAMTVSFHLVGGSVCPGVLGGNCVLGDLGDPVPLRNWDAWGARDSTATRGRGEQQNERYRSHRILVRLRHSR